MIEFLVCGLMMYYHVDCIQFYFYDGNNTYPLYGTPYHFSGFSEIEAGIGILHVYTDNGKFRDACGLSPLEHELQRFHQNRWNLGFCNDLNAYKAK